MGSKEGWFRATCVLFLTLGCRDSTASLPPTPLALIPSGNVVLDAQFSRLVPLYDSSGSWGFSLWNECSVSDTSVLILEPSDVVMCVFDTRNVTGTALIKVQVGNQVGEIPVSVRHLSKISPGTLEVGTISPSWLAVGANNMAYFTALTNAPASFIYRENLSTGQTDEVPFNSGPTEQAGAVLLNAGSDTAYAAVSDFVIRINTATNTPIDSVALDTLASEVNVFTEALSPGDSILYVGAGAHLLAVNVAGRPKIRWDLHTGANFVHVAVSPGGDRIYASAQLLPGSYPHVVYDVDADSGTISRTLPVDSMVQGVTTNLDGSSVYVASESGLIYSCAIGPQIQCRKASSGNGQWGLVASSDGKTLYASNGPLFAEGPNAVWTFDATTLAPTGYVGFTGRPGRLVVTATGVMAVADGFIRLP